MRGRVQISWMFSNQTRANAALTWLNGQLSGRSYIAEQLPAAARGTDGVWRMQGEVAIETVTEGEVVRALVAARQDADPFVQAGSLWRSHECDHYDGANTCAATVVETVK